MNKILHSPETLMNAVNPQLGATYALVSFLHVVIGACLAVFNRHAVNTMLVALNSDFDKVLLKLVDVLYTIKDAF